MTVRPARPASAAARPAAPFPPERPPWWPSPGPHERPGIYERLLGQRIVMAHGQLDDGAATRLCAQLLTLDAEGDGPIRFELQNLGADLTAALAVMGVLDVVGVPVQARAAGRITGPALGVLAACGQRCGYPNALFVLSEPVVSFDGPLTAVAAREEQTRAMLDALYVRLAEVTGREVGRIRDDARARRVLTAADAERYGLLAGRR